MARRRRSPSKVDLQKVLRFLAEASERDYDSLIIWIEETFGCRARAAKDNIAILVRGGWVAAVPVQDDHRRKRYTLTEKGRADMVGAFGEGALTRGRRRYSTCLSGDARRRQAARRAAGTNELVEALEANARRLFGGLTYAELTPPLGPDGKPPPLRLRTRKPSRFGARLRAELLGERSAVPDDKSGFGPRLRAELLGECSAVREDA